MKTVRAGVIGAGVFGGHHARKYAADSRVQLVAVCDPNVERAEALAGPLGAEAIDEIDAFLAMADLVTIAAPAATHAGLAERALGAGKHVLVEKPLAVDVEQGERLVAAAAEARRVLACGHQERLVFEAMGLMALPERPTRIESVRAGPWTGRGDDVSVTMDLMSHDLDLALTLMGVQPRRVSARGKRVETSSADEITALLTFPDDARAELTASRIAAERARTMRLVYPSGEVAIDFIARSFDNTTPFALNAHFADTAEGRDPLGANVARFIDAVLGVAARPAVTGAEALEAMRLARTIDTAASLPSYARRRTPTNDPVH